MDQRIAKVLETHNRLIDVLYKNVSMSTGTPTITLMAKSEVANESGSKRLFRRFLSTTIGKQTTQMPTIAAVTMIM